MLPALSKPSIVTCLDQLSNCNSWIRLLLVLVALFCPVLPFQFVTPNAVAVANQKNVDNTASILIVAETIPGNNPDNLTPLLRFQFTETGQLSPITAVPAFPATAIQDPSFLVFNSSRELFVANRHGNVVGGAGSIARFKFDESGNYIANGIIEGNSLEAVHGLAFSPGGELFAANLSNGLISRFIIDQNGVSIANGSFPTNETHNEGVAFSADGELFTTHSNNLIRRWRIDPATQNVTANDTIIIPEASRLHGLAFSRAGELFAADPDTNQVFRIQLDGTGNATLHGSISDVSGAIGLAFSEQGELFITGHGTGGITRFLFDANGDATQNGPTYATNSLGGAAVLSVPSFTNNSLTFVSDTSWKVYAADPINGAASLMGNAQKVCVNESVPVPCPGDAVIYGYIYGYPGNTWSADLTTIPGANWIWAPNIDSSTSPAELQHYYFSKILNLPDRPIAASLSIAVDDYAEVFVNGALVGAIGSTTNGGDAQQAQGPLTHFNILPYLVIGDNAIVIHAQNGSAYFSGICPDSCTYQQNPAGVVFGGAIRYGVCENNDLIQEAESGLLSGNFVIGDDTRANGGQCIVAPTGTSSFWNGPVAPHRAEYCFNIPADGVYRLRTHVAAYDTLSDSFYVQVDNAPSRGYLWDVLLNNDYALDYVNDRSAADPVEFALSAGPHLVSIYVREAGTRLDTVEMQQISTDSTPIPTCAGLTQEAENGALFGSFTTGSDPSASSGAYVHLPNGMGDFWSGPNPRQKVDFCFEVPTDGTYRIDGKVYGADNLSDSFYVKVDNAPSTGYLWDVLPNTTYLVDSVNDRNQFLDTIVVSLTSGPHIVSIYAREDGTRLDTLQLVPTALIAQSHSAQILAKGIAVTLKPTMTGQRKEFEFTNISATLLDAATQGATYQQSAQVDQFGQIHFDGMPPGEYQLQFALPTGYHVSSPALKILASADSMTDVAVEISQKPTGSEGSTTIYLPLIQQ